MLATFALTTLQKPEEVSKTTKILRHRIPRPPELELLSFLKPPQVLARCSPLNCFLGPPQVWAIFALNTLSKPEKVRAKPLKIIVFKVLSRTLLKPHEVMKTSKLVDISQLPDSGSH